MNAHVENLLAQAHKTITDGIYFGMTDEVYHADPALGSTSLKKLVDNAPDYWWSSAMNPAREPDTDTPAKIFGRAVHRCVLEGRVAFEKEYAPTDFNGNTREGKAERAGIADAGKTPLKRDDYGRILAAASFIKANASFRSAFEGGYPEVSVFWTVDGIRFKARFDYLRQKAIADLKSIRNPMGKTFEKACRDRVAELEYTISAEHYSEARRQMSRLIKQGDVYGAPAGDPLDMPWLINVAAHKDFAFVLIFWQAEGAPISTGFTLSPGNPLLASARASISKAIHNYRTFLEQFGTDTAWVPSTPLNELDETDLPVWYQQRLMTGA